VGVRALAKNFRHGTPDRAEAKESHVAVLRAVFLFSNDSAVASSIAFIETCHRSIIAEAEWRLRGFAPNCKSNIPAQAELAQQPRLNRLDIL